MAFDQSAKFVVEELVIRERGAITFPDNTTQATAYFEPRYGQVVKTTTGTIEIEDAGVYQSTGLQGTLNELADGVGLGEDDTLAVKNTSGETRIFQITATMDCTTSGTVVVGIALALNGDVILDTECRATSVATQVKKNHTTWLVELEDGDEIALYVANFTNDNAIAFNRGRIVARTI
jgi:hypothetical protein